MVALVQKKVIINVKAGENRGAKLSHTNVVRTFKTQTATTKNEFDLAIPKDLNGNPWELIVYAQQQSDFKVTGAVLFTPDKN